MRTKFGPILLLSCWLLAWTDDVSVALGAPAPTDEAAASEQDISLIALRYKKQIVERIEVPPGLPDVGGTAGSLPPASLPRPWLARPAPRVLSGADRHYLLMSLQR